MTTFEVVIEFSWMILFLVTAIFMLGALIKEFKLGAKSGKLMLLYIGCLFWVCGNSVDSVGTYFLSSGSWMVDGSGTSGSLREALFGLRTVCSMIGCTLVLLSVIGVLFKNSCKQSQ